MPLDADRHPITGRWLAYDCERDCQEHCAGLCGPTVPEPYPDHDDSEHGR